MEQLPSHGRFGIGSRKKRMCDCKTWPCCAAVTLARMMPSASAVMICAAVPGVMPNDVASTGMAGTIIDHMPASSALE